MQKTTQKHVKHTLRLLAQQESTFLDRRIIGAENERTEMAKRDTSNKQRISIDQNHDIANRVLPWQAKTKNAVHSLGSSLKRAVGQVKKTFNATKTVTFASKRQVRVYRQQDVAAMITYDSGADGHYISEGDRKAACLPILRRSTKRVGVANGGTSSAKMSRRCLSNNYQPKPTKLIPLTTSQHH